MIGPSASGAKWEEKVECAFFLEQFQHLKKSEAGEKLAAGSIVSDASATSPLTLRHVCIREGNHRGCHKRSWTWSWGGVLPMNGA
jgi:hypothetical protein